MKLTLRETNFTPLTKTEPAISYLSPTNITSFTPKNPQITPHRLYKVNTYTKQQNEDYIKSPFQNDKFLYPKKTIRNQFKNIFEQDNIEIGLSSYGKNGKNYVVKQKRPQQSRPMIRSSSTLEMRETLTYVEQILNDLVDRSNYGLAKRYINKLENGNLKIKLQKLISQIQDKNQMNDKRQQQIKNALLKLIKSNFRYETQFQQLPVDKLIREIEKGISKLWKGGRQKNRREESKEKVRQLKEESQVRNVKLQNESNQLYKLFEAQKIKMKEHYQSIYVKIYQENNRIKRQIEIKDKNIYDINKEHSSFKNKYQKIFKEISQQLRDIRLECGNLKQQNSNINQKNESILQRMKQKDKELFQTSIKMTEIETENRELKIKKIILSEQNSKLQSLNQKLKKYTECVLKESKNNNKEQLYPQQLQQQISSGKKYMNESESFENIESSQSQFQKIGKKERQKFIDQTSNANDLPLIEGQLCQKRLYLSQILQEITLRQSQKQIIQERLLILQNQVNQKQKQIHQTDNQLKQQRNSIKKQKDKLDQVIERYESKNKINSGLQNVIQMSKNQIKKLNQQIQNKTLEFNILQKKSKFYENNIKQLDKESNSKTGQLQNKQKLIQQSERKLQQIKLEVAENNNNLNKIQNKLLQLKLQQNQLKQIILSEQQKIRQIDNNCKINNDLLSKSQRQTKIKQNQIFSLQKNIQMLNEQVLQKKQKLMNLKVKQDELILAIQKKNQIEHELQQKKIQLLIKTKQYEEVSKELTARIRACNEYKNKTEELSIKITQYQLKLQNKSKIMTQLQNKIQAQQIKLHQISLKTVSSQILTQHSNHKSLINQQPSNDQFKLIKINNPDAAQHLIQQNNSFSLIKEQSELQIQIQHSNKQIQTNRIQLCQQLQQIKQNQIFLNQQYHQIQSNKSQLNKYMTMLSEIADLQSDGLLDLSQCDQFSELIKINKLAVQQSIEQLIKMKQQKINLFAEIEKNKDQIEKQYHFISQINQHLIQINKRVSDEEKYIKTLESYKRKIEAQISEKQNIKKQMNEKLISLQHKIGITQHEIFKKQTQINPVKRDNETQQFTQFSPDFISIKKQKYQLESQVYKLSQIKQNLQEQIAKLDEIVVILQSDIWLKENKLKN